MGPDGFISCFDQLMDASALRHMIILKGGPGVGKSTFMRRVHAAMGGEKTPSTIYFCSGDPDSLDAVAIPEKGLLVLDGTAPHVVDPKIPGARDSLINLGECLDEAAMRPNLPQIRACMEEHAICSRRARAYMQAAAALMRENAAVFEALIDPKRMAQITRALIHTVLAEAGQPQNAPAVRRVITEAVTPKGELSFIAENARTHVIRVCHPWGMDVTPILREVSAAVRAAGWSVEEHLRPAVPGQLLHVGIPGLDTLITTSDALPSEMTFDFSGCVCRSALMRQECAMEQGRAAIKLHMHRAVGALAQAKQLHDELETFYVPNMDFECWQKKLDKTLETLADT